MALVDVINTVIDNTGRVDKTAYIQQAVNPVVQAIASIKDFPITLTEIKYPVSNTVSVHTLQLPTDYRKTSYLRPAPWAKLLTPIIPRNGISQGQEVVDSYYESGTSLVVNLAPHHMTTEFAFGYYAHPAPLTQDTDTNWVLDTYGDVVIDMLIAKVLRITGDANGAQVIENGTALRMQQILNTGTLAELVY